MNDIFHFKNPCFRLVGLKREPVQNCGNYSYVPWSSTWIAQHWTKLSPTLSSIVLWWKSYSNTWNTKFIYKKFIRVFLLLIRWPLHFVHFFTNFLRICEKILTGNLHLFYYQLKEPFHFRVYSIYFLVFWNRIVATRL